jgi:hypothetical protein
MTQIPYGNIIQGSIYPSGAPLRIPDVPALAAVRENGLAVQRPFLADPPPRRIPAAGHRGHDDPATAEGR